MRWMLQNSHGKRDALLTMSVATLGVILVKVLFAGCTFGELTIGPAPDAATIGVLLGSTVVGYVARRNRILATGQEEPKP